jgi:Tol biopolymer transport system component
MRPITTILAVCPLLLLGCAIQNNPTPTTSESDSLYDVVQLTSTFDRAGEAYFSKDMNWIVFQAVLPGEQHYQMFIAQLKWDDNGIAGLATPIRISPANSRNTCGYFAPDGHTLIFASTAGKEDPEAPTAGYQRQGRDYRWSYPKGMEIYRADGWQGAVAAAQPGMIIDLAKHRLTDNEFYDAEGSISPDGKWIVFTSNRDGDLELYAMRLDGTNPVRLTRKPGYDGGPFFSPDGKRILYRSDRQGNDLLQIFTADLLFDGAGNILGAANERQLTNDEKVNWGPYWHPQGRHILYASNDENHNYDLWLMRADGSHKTRITFDANADVLPVFSPHGKYVIWSSKRNGVTTQVYVAKFKFPPGS